MNVDFRAQWTSLPSAEWNLKRVPEKKKRNPPSVSRTRVDWEIFNCSVPALFLLDRFQESSFLTVFL